MQAPKGPRGRGRGKGAIRAAASTKTNGDDEDNKRAGRKVRFTGSSSSASLAAAAPSHQPKTQTGPASFRNKQLRNNDSPNNAHRTNGVFQGDSVTASNPLTNQAWRDPTFAENSGTYNKRMSELYQTLKRNREKERKDAIRDGFLADPNKPTLLAHAITPVGTCPDMCPEFERVERIVQLTVDGCEKTPGGSSNGKDVPCEDHMVKRFRRSAAGYDEQLPSDIRPPAVLQRTLNYLLDEVVGGPQPLATVHKFVWDRTRGIRNDFSIQQVTKFADLRIAIDCFERIARFHILSLHQLSRPEQDNGEFDQHQEREQLNNTLLSLMYYYDDSRHKIQSVNEAEFRAYCIIFEIQDMRPDLEDRAQNWPRHILHDGRIQAALSLYAAAGSTADYQGPLRPFTTNLIAQANYGRFWSVVASNAVSYLMACAAEIYFNLVRRMALGSIWKAYRRGGTAKTEDWTLGELVVALGFDEEEQARSFCEEHGFSIGERADGQSYLILALPSGTVPSDSVSRRKQVFSRTLVESKRLGRTLPAVINGVTASEAAARGMMEESPSEESRSPRESGNDSLFITDHSDEEKPTESAETNKSIFTNLSETQSKPSSFSSPFSLPASGNPFGASTTLTPQTNPFNLPSTSVTSSTTVFGKGADTPQSTFGTPSSSVTSFGTSSIFGASSNPFKTNTTPKFNFLQPPSTVNPTTDSTVTAEPSPKSTFGLPPSSPGLSVLPRFDHPARSNNVGAKGDMTTTFGTITSSSISQPQTTNTLFNFNAPQQSQLQSLFPPNPIKTPTTQQALSQTSPFPPAAISDNPNLLDAPVSSDHHSSTENNLPSVQNTSWQPMQTMPVSPFTALPAASNTRSSTSPLTTSSIPSSTTTSESSQSTQPPQTNKPTNKSATSLPRSTKPAESLRFLGQSSNTKPKVSSPLAKPAITPPSPPENEKPSTEDERRTFLDKLAEDVMLGPNGLLEQFIEHTVGSIICDAYDQVQGEECWERAGEVRGRILGRKYIKRWKDIAWRLGLLRKGRERRRTFGESMRALAVDSKMRRSAEAEREGLLGLSVFSRSDKAVRKETRFEAESVRQPEKSHAPQTTRRSLGTKSRNTEKQSVDGGGLQQHHQKAILTNGSTMRPSRVSKSHHKRSQTLGSLSDMGQSRHGSSARAEALLRASPSKTKSLLSNSTLAKARQLVPSGRLDTTRTDYFRLKALGIDPVTMAPSTMSAGSKQRKRVREDDSDMSLRKAPRLTPPRTETLSTIDSGPRSVALDASRSPPGQKPLRLSQANINDEDEQLLAQVRSMREAMSESISWFQEERAKSELSRGSSGEEAGEMNKARTFVSTPSRTEQRLARTGGHGFATKPVVVPKRSIREGKKPDYGHPPAEPEGKASAPRGFAAFAGSGSPFTFTERAGAKPALQARGNSVEDAIEL